MPKCKTPTNGERFDALLQNLGEATGNDAEIAALHEIANALWQLLSPEQETAFFDAVVPLEAKAVRWAGASDDHPTPSPRPVGRPEAMARACECLLEAFKESGDLNDLPASEVIAMLEAALGRKRGKETADTGNVATNAAQIGYSIDWGELTPAGLEQVVVAATALDTIEREPNFSWDTQPNHWESVCANIADAVRLSRVKSWTKEIRRLLK